MNKTLIYTDAPVTANKITIAKDEVRLKISNQLSPEDQKLVEIKMDKILDQFFKEIRCDYTLRASFALDATEIAFKTDNKKAPTYFKLVL